MPGIVELQSKLPAGHPLGNVASDTEADQILGAAPKIPVPVVQGAPPSGEYPLASLKGNLRRIEQGIQEDNQEMIVTAVHAMARGLGLL